MTEKQFLRAIDEYFETGKQFYQANGRAIYVDFNTVTRYKSLPDDDPEFQETGICSE